jgi:hypothetical protein
LGPRHFQLTPWPFGEQELHFNFPARHVEGKVFSTSAELNAAFTAAEQRTLTVTLTS